MVTKKGNAFFPAFATFFIFVVGFCCIDVSDGWSATTTTTPKTRTIADFFVGGNVDRQLSTTENAVATSADAEKNDGNPVKVVVGSTRDLMKKVVSSMALMTCVGLLFVLPPLADAAPPTTPAANLEFKCPQSFSSQPLGIQSVVGIQQESPLQEQKADKTRKTSNSNFCMATSVSNNDNFEYSIQGLIYLPSSSISSTSLRTTSIVNQKNRLPLFESDDYLMIEISTADKPSTVLAGAKIPMQQIQSFPISFSISKDNLITLPIEDDQKELEESWDNTVLYYRSDLYVTAKVCPSSAVCTSEDTKLQGRGFSKLLLLPGYSDNEEEFALRRAAASIRLSQSSKPDILFTW